MILRRLFLVGALAALGCDSSADERPPATAADTGTPPVDATVDSTDVDAAVDAGGESGDETGGDAGADVLGEDAPYSAPDAVSVPALPTVDLSKFPKDDAGRPLLLEGPRVSIAVGAPWKNAASALARCASSVTHCVDLPIKTLDACMFSVPRCKTDKPWDEADACCPTTCWDRYEALRKAGVAPIPAFDKVLFLESCMPGAAAPIGGAK